MIVRKADLRRSLGTLLDVVFRPNSHIVEVRAETQAVLRPSLKLRRRRTGRGRERLWRPRKITAEDEQEAVRLKEQWSSDEKTATRVRNDFLVVCTESHSECDSALWGVIGQMRRDGLTLGTILNYVGHLKPLLTRSLYRQAHSILSLAYADSDTQHAPDLPPESLNAIVGFAPPHLSTYFFIMRTTGARCRDLQRLRWSQIRLEENGLTIEFRVTKNRRYRRHRRSVTFPFWFIQPTQTVHIPVVGRLDTRKPFAEIHSARCDHEIAKICREHGIRHATSYSFRRAFMQHLKHIFPGDLPQQQKYSMHLCTSMIDAHYARDLWDDELE